MYCWCHTDVMSYWSNVILMSYDVILMSYVILVSYDAIPVNRAQLSCWASHILYTQPACFTSQKFIDHQYIHSCVGLSSLDMSRLTANRTDPSDAGRLEPPRQERQSHDLRTEGQTHRRSFCISSGHQKKVEINEHVEWNKLDLQLALLLCSGWVEIQVRVS